MSSSGIRVELSVDSADVCPVANISSEAGTVVTNVARSAADSNGQGVKEFTVADADGAIESRSDVEQIFGAKNGGRYRLEGECPTCPCEAVEAFACPISDVNAENGQLLLTFYAPDIDRIRAIVNRMQDLFDDVSLRSLQQNGTAEPDDTVLVDRSQLTDRQREVLETAVEMGYFEYPKGANAGEVAEALGITISTFAEHIAAAQTKLLRVIVED